MRRSSRPLPLAGAPPVSLGLRRFVLRSVGPVAARFHPLDLDLVTPDGSLARRALCVLTNTGGKSTLLKLLSAVINPRAAGLIGKGEIADMVLATDTAHVVLEWEQADGTRYVTGWVGQWKDLHKPASGTDALQQRWYLFRVAGFGVDDLPFEQAGQRIRFDEFRRLLRALFVQHPGSLGVMTRNQKEWSQVLLDKTRIDAELFRYQATMNAAESGAAALVTSLKTADSFVGFFVSAFDDDALTATLFREVGAYTAQAASRATMEAHATLCEELVDALQAFVLADGNHTDALDMEVADTERRREFAGSVRARADTEAARATEAEEVLAGENERLLLINRAIDADEDRRKQYLLLEAEMRLVSATGARVDAEAAERRLDLERNAWAAVPVVVAHEEAVTKLRSAEAAFDAAEHELVPFRARAERAAARLVAGLRAQAGEANALAAKAQERAGLQLALSRQATARRELALENAAALRSELERNDERAAKAGESLAEARRRGDAGQEETAACASARWLTAQQEEAERGRRAASEKAQAVIAQRRAADDRSAGELEMQKASQAATRAAERLDEAAASAAGLLADPDVASVIGGAGDSAPAHRAVPAGVALAAAGAIEDQAEAVELSARRTSTELTTVEAELARLSGTDLLAAGPDVVAALGALRDAQIGALAGWTWVAEAVPAEDRPAFIVARPDVVNGVVVNDPSRLDRAREVLDKAGLFPRLAVVVTTTRTATTTANNLPADVSDRFVVDPHPGLYDKEKAKDEIARLEERQCLLASRLQDQVERSRELRVAAGRARRHASEWDENTLDDLEGQKVEAERARTKANERITRAIAARRQAARAEQDAAGAEQAAGQAERVAGEARVRLVGVVEAEAAAAAHADSRPSILNAISGHDGDASAASAAAADAADSAKSAEAEQSAAERLASDLSERAARIGTAPAQKVPSESLIVLEAEHVAANQAFADEAAGRDHLDELNRAKDAVARTAEPLSGVPAPIQEEALRCASSVLAGTPAAVRFQAAASFDAWKRAFACVSDCKRDVGVWEEAVRSHRPTDRAVHATLPADQTPTDADDAGQRASELNRVLYAERARRDVQQVARDAAERTRDEASKAAADFARLVSGQDDPRAAADVFVGDVDAAFMELDRRRKAVDDVRDLVRRMAGDRQRSAHEVNAKANDRRWADITDSLKDHCAVAAADALSEHGLRYLDALRTRQGSLRDDIGDLDRHRSAVIDSLGQACDRLRRNLQRVRSASTLPPQVQHVGGHQAIMVDFKRLPTEAANAALATLLDEWAAMGADMRDTKARRARLLQALSATVEARPLLGRWSVKVLKPRIDGDVTYCAPDRIEREYSGGQELTLALMLYCTLAAVRSEDRTGSDRPPGLLLLDNPFGAASNERLIEMWQKLAAAADVQILCFTALGDPAILNAFNGPGTYRHVLRNDRNQRNGHMHVRPVGASSAVSALVADHLAGRPLEEGEEARVDGVSYQTKPAFAVAPPGASQDH